MMPLLPDLLGVIERFVLRRKASRAQVSAEHRQAVESLLAAVLATERYVFDSTRRGKPSRSREAALAELWARAAIDVRAVDGRLSRIALLTSFAWANPDLLEKEEYREVPVQLDLIRAQCEWLLEHWS